MRSAIGLALFLCIAIPLYSAPATQPTIEARSGQLLADWQARFKEEGFTALVAGPFVLAGDGSAEQVARYRDGTVLSAARAMHATYFNAEPAEPILILLFESDASYRRLARKWLNDATVPHYGYFRHDNIMVMNVATGTGTLVHELTHALIKPDFPDVPSWFNEGLASLYEQCTMATGTIRGLVNWRLPGLKKAIKANTLRPFAELINDPQFCREDLVGINYAQSRYLMLYLQEKGRLTNYYKVFRGDVKEDPTGLETLKQIVAPQSFDVFEKEWRAWVMTLKFE